MKLVQACLCAGNTLQRRFNRRRGAVNHVQACLSARKYLESSLHHSGDPVKLVKPCLFAENILQRSFNRRGDAVKQVLACLSVRKDLESSFHHCGGLVKQTCL